MDVAALTIFKITIAAALALLSYRKAKTLPFLTRTPKQQQSSAVLKEIPLDDKNQSKQESTLSLSTVSKRTFTLEQYKILYADINLKEDQGEQSEIEQRSAMEEESQIQIIPPTIIKQDRNNRIQAKISEKKQAQEIKQQKQEMDIQHPQNQQQTQHQKRCYHFRSFLFGKNKEINKQQIIRHKHNMSTQFKNLKTKLIKPEARPHRFPHRNQH